MPDQATPSRDRFGTMLSNGGASIRCPQRKMPLHSRQDNGDHPQAFVKVNDKSSVLLRGNRVEPESKSSAPPYEGYYRPMHQFYRYSGYESYHSHTQKEHQGKVHVSESQFYVARDYYMFPVNVQYQYTSGVPHQSCWKYSRFQDFQYFVVIDFEATCDEEKNPHPQEIIEFPSVIVNSVTGQLEDFFQIYVRPTCNKHLTDFCKELTGIQQVQVDKGVLLSEALFMHDRWLEKKGIKHTNFAVVTWSNWDCHVMLESECRYKKIRKPPYFNRWINLKVPFHEVFGGIRCNLKEAVQLAGLVWEGRAHCGLDDAKNTARLLAHLMHRGIRFSITNSLSNLLCAQLVGHSISWIANLALASSSGTDHNTNQCLFCCSTQSKRNPGRSSLLTAIVG